jgi:hypothetical protein
MYCFSLLLLHCGEIAFAMTFKNKNKLHVELKSVASLWLHCGFTVASLGFTVASLWLHCGFTVTSLWLHCGFTVASLWLHCYFTVLIYLFFEH